MFHFIHMRQHMYKGIHCTIAAKDGKQLRVHQKGLGSMSYSLSTMEHSSVKKKKKKKNLRRWGKMRKMF